jgi:hypothetical protein
MNNLFRDRKFHTLRESEPVTVAERSEACTVFARSEAGIVGSNPKNGMDAWCVYMRLLCLCYPVFRERPCGGLIPRPRRPTVCKNVRETQKSAPCSEVGARGYIYIFVVHSLKDSVSSSYGVR